MAKNYWMVVQTAENFEISKELGFTVHGLRSRTRRRAERMSPDDRVLFYVTGIRKWTVLASIASRYFEDRTPIWKPGPTNEEFPYRVKLKPSIILKEADYIDALVLAPRLEYVKKWRPEDWPLAFFDTLHLLPQRDFRLIEAEMKRIVSRGRPSSGRRSRGRDRRDRRERQGDGSDRRTPTPRSEAVATADREDDRPVQDQVEAVRLIDGQEDAPAQGSADVSGVLDRTEDETVHDQVESVVAVDGQESAPAQQSTDVSGTLDRAEDEAVPDQVEAVAAVDGPEDAPTTGPAEVSEETQPQGRADESGTSDETVPQESATGDGAGDLTPDDRP